MTQSLEEMKKKAKEEFWAKNGNPDTLSSVSQFHPDIQGQLPRVIDETIDTLIEQVWNARGEEVYKNEREYWIGVFDSAPVRENEHPHDIVARNFACIEVNRIDGILAALTPKPLERFGFEPRYPDGIPEDTPKINNDN